MPLIRSVLAVLLLTALASRSLAQEEPRPHTAVLKVHGVTIEEGTAEARVPITISSRYEGQTLHGIAITPTVEGGMQILNQDDWHAETMFNAHPTATFWMAELMPGMRMYIQQAWTPPWEMPCEGVVMMLVLDTSRLKVGEYWIKTDGYTAATDALDFVEYGRFSQMVLHHEPATVKVVPRKQ